MELLDSIPQPSNMVMLGFDCVEEYLNILKEEDLQICGLGTFQQLYSIYPNEIKYDSSNDMFRALINICIKAESDDYLYRDLKYKDLTRQYNLELEILNVLNWNVIKSTAERYAYVILSEDSRMHLVYKILSLRFLYEELESFSQKDLAFAAVRMVLTSSEAKKFPLTETQIECLKILIDKCFEEIPDEYNLIYEYLNVLTCDKVGSIIKTIRSEIQPTYKNFLSSSIHHYVEGKILGSGTYGKVFISKDSGNNEYAVKEFIGLKTQEGVGNGALSEISYMHLLHHKNIVSPKEYIFHDDKLFLILELLDTTLYNYIRTHKDLTITEIKYIMKELLEGLAYLHKNNILHRDIKTENVLITNDLKKIKLSDFGLSKMLLDYKLNSHVCTPNYRPPEIFFMKDLYYGKALDMWSIGCVFGELIMKRVMFATAKKDADDSFYLEQMFRFSGIPSREIYNEYYFENFKNEENLQKYDEVVDLCKRMNYKKCIIPDDAGDLLMKFLNIDPAQRISAEDALKHPFFEEE